MARKAHVYRNFGIIAHVDAGKTTLTERVLYYCGAIHRMGEVHEGSTVTDDHPISRAKGITIRASAVTAHWRGHRLQLIDTPGHVDFTVEVERSLRVLDGALVVLDGVAGVEPQTETVWKQADRHGVPRLVFINKLDRPGADAGRCLCELERRLGARPLPINWPIYRGGELAGVHDLITMRTLIWRPGGDGSDYDQEPITSSEAQEILELRDRLLCACAEEDERFADQFLAGQPPNPERIREIVRKLTLERRIIPALCGSAYKNIGVQPAIDAIADYLPSPLDRAAVTGVEGHASRAPEDQAPFSALVFKILHTEQGQLNLIRIYSGTISKGTPLLCPRTGERLVVGRILRMFASKVEDLSEAGAGEIVALIAASLRTGDTLADPEHALVLEDLRIPPPVVRLAVEPRTRADHDRMARAFAKMAIEDPSLAIETDPETGQIVFAGMGELHLETAVLRARQEHGVDLSVGRPRVAYRETIARSITREYEHKKQSGGPGQYAKLRLKLSPRALGSGWEFVDRTRGGVLRKDLVPAVRAGIERAMSSGPIDGHPVVDVAVELLDGAYHVKDSNAFVFELAAALAFREAMLAAQPVLLEPIMRVEIGVRAESLGRVLGDLGMRRGRVESLSEVDAERRVIALVPLQEMFGYMDVLRSMTQGYGRMSMSLLEYRPAPVDPQPGRPTAAA